MIHLKTPQEIELMKTGGMMLSMVVKEAAEFVRPGMTTKEIDDFATILSPNCSACSKTCSALT